MIILFVWRCFECGNIFSNDKNAKVCPNCRNDYIKSIQINEETDKRIKELEEGSAKTKGFLESPRKKLGDVEK